MKKKLAVCTILYLMPVITGAWTVTPVMEKRFGTAGYVIRFTDDQQDYLGGVGKSELLYPIDVWMAGGQVRHEGTMTLRDSLRTWSVAASGWANISEPVSEMTDRDWGGVTDGNYDLLLEFSNTSSVCELGGYGGTLQATLDGFRIFNTRYILGIRYFYQHLEYDVIGISTGWQLDVDTLTDETEKFYFNDLFPDTSVLTYDMTCHSLAATGTWRLMERGPATWDWTCLLSPFTFCWDRDYHLLRGKMSEAFTWGYTLGVSSDIRYRITGAMEGYVHVAGEYMRAAGSSYQEWYKDEDYGNGDVVTAGTRIEDIDTWIKSLNAAIRTGLSYSF